MSEESRYCTRCESYHPSDQSCLMAIAGDAAGIIVKLPNKRAKELLISALKWIRRIEERKEDLPLSFLDNCDPKPLRKKIEEFLGDARIPISELLSDPQVGGFLPHPSTSTKTMSEIEEDGDEIVTPMPEFCGNPARIPFHQPHVKLVVEKGFLICTECFVSYGPVQQKNHEH